MYIYIYVYVYMYICIHVHIWLFRSVFLRQELGQTLWFQGHGHVTLEEGHLCHRVEKLAELGTTMENYGTMDHFWMVYLGLSIETWLNMA